MSNDKLLKGIEDFNIKSEQYYCHIYPIIKVCATTVFKDSRDEWIDG